MWGPPGSVLALMGPNPIAAATAREEQLQQVTGGPDRNRTINADNHIEWPAIAPTMLAPHPGLFVIWAVETLLSTSAINSFHY